MFTGIVEEVGIVKNIVSDESNLIAAIFCSFLDELKIDQSISHNGVCLTITDIKDDYYLVTIIRETLSKTNLGNLKAGDAINLERSMMMTARLDGHLVQGHIDQTAVCKELKNLNGSWLFTFNYDKSFNNLTVEKGSVCVNGVSLTVVNQREAEFSVAIIPYTFNNTNFKYLKEGSIVNVEFDIIGKYVQQYLKHQLFNQHG